MVTGLCSWNSQVLPCSPPAWHGWLDRLSGFWRLSYSTSKGVMPCRAEARFPKRLHMLWIGVQEMVMFQSQNSMVQESRGGHISAIIHHYPYWSTSKMFASCPCGPLYSWFRGLSSKRGASMERHDNNLLYWELKVATQPWAGVWLKQSSCLSMCHTKDLITSMENKNGRFCCKTHKK